MTAVGECGEVRLNRVLFFIRVCDNITHRTMTVQFTYPYLPGGQSGDSHRCQFSEACSTVRTWVLVICTWTFFVDEVVPLACL
jgi:hypothetical protein